MDPSQSAESPTTPPKSTGKVHYNRRLVAIALLICVFFCASAVLSYRSIGMMATNNRDITNSLHTLNLINELKIEIVQAESGQRGYLLTHDPQYLNPYHKALSRIDDLLERLRIARTLIPVQLERFRQLYNLTQRKITEMKATVLQAENDLTGAAINAIRSDIGIKLMQEIDKLINRMIVDERLLMLEKRSAAEDNRLLMLVILIITNIIGLLMILGIFFLIHRHNRHMAELNLKIELANIELESKVESRTKQLNLYAQELERSNRELEEFAFVASHDLQEPLRKIQAFGDRLNHKYGQVLDARGMDYIKRMNSASLRMSDLIEDLLSFSRVSTRQQPFQSVDLNQILADALDDLEIVIENRQAQITVPNMPCIEGDPSQLGQVFLNLLSNSLKFCPADRTPVITLDFDRCNDYAPADDARDWLRIELRDNGIGFDIEYRDRVFHLFQRLHGREEYSGTGIGLALCRKIIERHGGSIQAHGLPDQGATFTIFLPTTQVELAAMPDR